MPNPNNANMSVTLPLSGPTGRLSVGDSNAQNQISAYAQPTNIVWNLGSALLRATFVPMSAQPPGFEWIQPGGPPISPVAYFGPALISNNGTTLTVADNHFDASTNGQWPYIIRVLFNGTVYATTNDPPGPGGTVNRPVIINK